MYWCMMVAKTNAGTDEILFFFFKASVTAPFNGSVSFVRFSSSSFNDFGLLCGTRIYYSSHTTSVSGNLTHYSVVLRAP